MKKDMPMAKKAKMDNLHALRRMAMGMIHNHSQMPQDSSPDLHQDGNEKGTMAPSHLEHVMVEAKDKSGLKKGLDKAKDLVSSFDDAEHEMQEPEQSMLDESPEGMRSSKMMDEDESEDAPKMGHDHMAHHSEDDGIEEGALRDHQSAASMLEKMRKSAKKKK